MLTCRILFPTIIKQNTEPASRLTTKFKAQLAKGDYPAVDYQQVSGNHFKVTFEEPIVAADGVTSYKTWCVYGDHLTLLNSYGMPDKSKELILPVPYYSQRDNVEEYWRTCNTSSHSMILNYLKPGSVKSDDDYFRRFVKNRFDSTDWGGHTRVLESFGIKSEFRTDLDYSDIDSQLNKGYPVAIGVLHKGSIQHGVSGGHVLVVIGREGDDYICHDPWGYGFGSYLDHNGRNVRYPKYPSLDVRWQPSGGFGRIIHSVK